MTLRLNGSTSGYVEIDAPATAGSNTLVLPTGNGTNGQVLSTNGSGVLSWISSVMLDAGSVSSPSLYISGDTNTGMWSPAADNLAWATGGTERMRIDNNGKIQVNTTNIRGAARVTIEGVGSDSTSSGLPLSINDTYTTAGGGSYAIAFYRVGSITGSITTTASATAYNTSSDYRLKENVTTVTDGITRLQQLKPSRFNFIVDPDKTVDGFLAHEVQAVVPEAITGDKDAVDEDGNPIYQGIDQSKLVPLLTAALQEAIAKIETQDAAIAALETRLAALEAAS